MKFVSRRNLVRDLKHLLEVDGERIGVLGSDIVYELVEEYVRHAHPKWACRTSVHPGISLRMDVNHGELTFINPQTAGNLDLLWKVKYNRIVVLGEVNKDLDGILAMYEVANPQTKIVRLRS